MLQLQSPPVADSAQWPSLLIVGSFLPEFPLERYAGGNLAEQVRKQGGLVTLTSRRRWQAMRLADMLWTVLVSRKQYDVAHITVFSGRAFMYAEYVAGLLSYLRKPITLSLHGGNLPAFSRRYPERVHRLFRRAKEVACPSRYLLEKLKPFRSDLRLIPNAIDIKRYPFQPRGHASYRLLWLRAFHNIYNPQMAVDVLAALLKRHPRTTLTMVGPDKGDGSLAAALKTAQARCIEDRITILGPVTKADVPEVMARHDLFLNTANVDNTPISILEALACGLPVVTTNVGGIPFLLQGGETGLLVPAGDAGAMTGAISAIFDNLSLASRLALQGRKLAESLDWSVALPKWRAFLHDAIANSR